MTLFLPSADRAATIDARLRNRLSGSLDYLTGFLDKSPAGLPAKLDHAKQRLLSAAVSPWVFGAYAQMVQAISRQDMRAARDAFDLFLAALGLPAAEPPAAFDGPQVPGPFWPIARMLFDTDPARPFAPRQPDPAQAAGCRDDIAAAMALLAEGDAEFHAELTALQRVILLGVADGDGGAPRFNGASTFFLWGAILLSATPRRSPALALDVLVHEASHLLLFGLVEGGALSRNDPAARYSSPLRADPRPIDGVFHACFVATRVHLAMTRLLLARRMPQAMMAEVAERADANAYAARNALGILRASLDPTPAGLSIFEALASYWQSADLAHA